jgi:NadR type nicotinamide-nucleotide adenylyltransferase
MEKTLLQQPSDIVKVVLFGPESTGKTTLARELSEHYDEPWVPEYAREFLQRKWDAEKEICSKEDLMDIAQGQIHHENELAARSRRLLVCDTDLLETLVYSELYFDGYAHPVLREAALSNTYDLYFLTDIDVPWEEDDLRDRPDDREEFFRAFRGALEQSGRKFVTLSGGREQRLQTAITTIDHLLNTTYGTHG